MPLDSAALAKSKISKAEKIKLDKEDNLKSDMILRFKVYHECFGKCKGIFDVDLFVSEDSPCIECLECECQFSPQRFVRHVHRSLENRTCHWGFDSANWRSYLLLCRDEPNYSRVVDLFQDLKDRHLPLSNTKRKLEVRREREAFHPFARALHFIFINSPMH